MPFFNICNQTIAQMTKCRLFAVFILITAVASGMPTISHAACKLPKSHYKNLACTSDSRYFLASKDDKTPVALLDKSGKKVADLMRLQAVDANKIGNGVMPVMRYDKVGYVDMTGKIVVPIEYDKLGKKNWARMANYGFIVVKKDGKFGVINIKGDALIAFSRDITTLRDFKDGKAFMTKAGVDYWLDSSGKVMPVQSLNAKIDESNVDKSRQLSSIIDNRHLIYTPHRMDGKWGFVDENMVTVITYSFDEVMPFSEGLAGVRIDDKWGFLNKAGQLVIAFRFDDAGIDRNLSHQQSANHQNQIFTFINGKAWIANLKNGDKICINTQGDSVNCGE